METSRRPLRTSLVACGGLVCGAVGGGAVGVAGAGHGAGRFQGVVRLDDGAAQPAGGLVPRADLDLDHVAGGHDGRAGGRAGEDHVAGFQGEQAGQVGHDVAEAEQHVLGRPGVLGQVPVDPGLQAQLREVDAPGIDQPGAERGEAVDPLGPDVGAAVGVAQVVDAEVVRGREVRHAGPPVGPADPASAAADDQRHLALEGEQLAAGRPRDRIAAGGQRGRGLEEVGRPGGHRAALGRAAAVAGVHRDDLAGNLVQGCHRAQNHIWPTARRTGRCGRPGGRAGRARAGRAVAGRARVAL